MSELAPVDIVLEVVGFAATDDVAPQRYLVRKRNGSFRPIELAWTDALRRDLEAIRWSTPDRGTFAAIGERLAPFLADEVDRILAAPERLPVRVSIQLQSVSPEMAALPWELIPLGESQLSLAALPNVMLRYEVAGTTSQRGAGGPPPEGGRILVAFSTMGGPVPSTAQCESILQACRAGHVDFDRGDVLSNRPYSALAVTLADAVAQGRPYTILHLLCHGGSLDAVTQSFGLIWGDERGRAVVLDPGVLAETLAPFTRAGLRLVVVSACHGGDPGTPGNPLRSVAERLHRAGVESVIASRLRLSIDAAKLLARVFYDQLLVASRSVEDAFRVARNHIFATLGASTMDHLALQLWGRRTDGWNARPIVFAPYRGLLAFERRHERFYFGRSGHDRDGKEREADELIRELTTLNAGLRPRLMLVAGDSGTGKSSMVSAGVIPRLEADGWSCQIMRPGAAPLSELDAVLDELSAGFVGRKASDLRAHPLLIVDQFEEIFSVATAEHRTPFVRRLWELARSREPRWSVLVVMRIDFLGRCGEIVLDHATGLRLDKFACDPTHQVLVPQMDTDQLRTAIERPAHAVGIELAAGLTDRLLEDVDKEPGALPLVQHTLSLLWQRREGRTLTQTAYDALGGVAGALNHHADGVIVEFARMGADHVELARRLLTRLVAIARGDTPLTGRRTRTAELRPDGETAARFDEVLGELVRQRLLVCSGDGVEQTVEVAHEALIRKWQLLGRWIDEERGKLLELEELRGWEETYRRHGTLLTQAQLTVGERLLHDGSMTLHRETRDLIHKSREELARVEEQARRFRDTLRVTLAREYLDKDHGISAALLREVEARTLLHVPSWFDCMTDALGRPGMTLALLAKHSDMIALVAWCPNGRRIASASAVTHTWPRAALDHKKKSFSTIDQTVRVWDAVSGEVLATFDGHEARLDAMAWSPDGTRIVTTSADRTARVWDAATGAELAVLRGHTGPVVAAAWSPDGGRLATAAFDGTARVWDARHGHQLAVLTTPRPEGHSGEDTRTIFSVHWDRRGLRVATDSAVWDAASGQLLAHLSGSGSRTWMARFDPFDCRIAVASVDGSAQILDAKTGCSLVRLEGHTDNVCAIEWSSDGARVVTASWDRTARLWDTITGATLCVLSGHQGEVVAASLNRDGTAVLTASHDRTARVWDAATGEVSVTLRGHDAAIFSAQWNPAGTHVVTGSEDRTARVWRVGTEVPCIIFQGHNGPILAAAWNPRGGTIISTAFAEPLVWDPASTAAPVALPGHTKPIRAIAWSPDGLQVATGSEDHTARLWEAATGRLLLTLTELTASVCSVAWSPDGTRILILTKTGEPCIWDAMDRRLRVQLNVPKEYITHASWNPDGTRVLTGTGTLAALRVWDAATGTVLVTLQGRKERCRLPVWSPDGTRIAICAEDRVVRVWSAATGRVITTLSGHTWHIEAATWSCDGTRIATTSQDKSARVWDAATGAMLAVLEGHGDMVHTAAWSPTDDKIVTASKDATARVWDAATGENLAVLRGHTDEIPIAAWSPDGVSVLTASIDGTARVWCLDAEQLRNHLWRVHPRCLSVRQRMRLLDEDEITAGTNAEHVLRERARRKLLDDGGRP